MDFVVVGVALQRASILRKKHGIHISGYNVPAPLESFEELSSRLVFVVHHVSCSVADLLILDICDMFWIDNVFTRFHRRNKCNADLILVGIFCFA